MTLSTFDPLVRHDRLGAFCGFNAVAVQGSGTGLLHGRSFAVKDVFDIAGTRTGFGNPDWLRTHAPAKATAEPVRRLLDSGSTMVGKTISDELCYSLTGVNAHYGTPINPRAPGRTAGGSSSGSAAAVAGGLADFALGTDCGGSVRIPASYCGLFGMRPSHGRVSTDGVVPFAPSFDVVGWFAREPSLLETVGRILLDPGRAIPFVRKRLLFAMDAFDLVDPALREVTLAAARSVGGWFGRREEVRLTTEPLHTWAQVFQTIQAFEIWSNHGPWITDTHPSLGPGIQERFAQAALVTPDAATNARRRRNEIGDIVGSLLGDDAVLCFPTSPRIAPETGTPTHTLEGAYRLQAMSLLCIAGLGGFPQITVPLCEHKGCPLGLSFLGPRNSDEHLLGLARKVMSVGDAIS